MCVSKLILYGIYSYLICISIAITIWQISYCTNFCGRLSLDLEYQCHFQWSVSELIVTLNMFIIQIIHNIHVYKWIIMECNLHCITNMYWSRKLAVSHGGVCYSNHTTVSICTNTWFDILPQKYINTHPRTDWDFETESDMPLSKNIWRITRLFCLQVFNEYLWYKIFTRKWM